MVMMVWTQRGEARHIVSMRYRHAREMRYRHAREEKKLLDRFKPT
jgi:hypothetical protein